MNLNFTKLLLFENKDYLAINKPAKVSSLHDRNDQTSIYELAKSYNDSLQVCHRLDKDTSGVLVLAKSKSAYRHLAIQLEHRNVKKYYHAIVEGICHLKNQVITLPLLIKDTKTIIDPRKGKSSETTFNTIKTYQKHTLVECMPLTGRKHQIRVHLASLNAPIINDYLYGGRTLYLSALKKKFNLKKDTTEQPLIQRTALHATRIEFTGLSDEKISIISPYPKDFKALLNQLEKNN